MIPGIDVSRYQLEIDWPKVARFGIRFAYIKATEGITHTDPFFKRNWPAAHAAGLPRGGYHYFRPRLDAKAQVRAFVQSLGDDLGELPPMLDLEASDLTGLELIRAAQIFLLELENLTGTRALIYTSPGFWASYVTPYPPEWPAEYPLWIAHYSVGRPTIPYPWTNYTFWQFTDRGEVAGITRFPARRPRVDMNWFSGTQAELDALCQAFSRQAG